MLKFDYTLNMYEKRNKRMSSFFTLWYFICSDGFYVALKLLWMTLLFLFVIVFNAVWSYPAVVHDYILTMLPVVCSCQTLRSPEQTSMDCFAECKKALTANCTQSVHFAFYIENNKKAFSFWYLTLPYYWMNFGLVTCWGCTPTLHPLTAGIGPCRPLLHWIGLKQV